MDHRPSDAILYRYIRDGVVASIIVPITLIPALKKSGWRVLIDEDQVRYADWEEAHWEDQRRFWKTWGRQ